MHSAKLTLSTVLDQASIRLNGLETFLKIHDPHDPLSELLGSIDVLSVATSSLNPLGRTRATVAIALLNPSHGDGNNVVKYQNYVRIPFGGPDSLLG